jgi:hypothetical protein
LRLRLSRALSASNLSLYTRFCRQSNHRRLILLPLWPEPVPFLSPHLDGCVPDAHSPSPSCLFSQLTRLRLPVRDGIRIVRRDHVESAFPLPSMQEPTHIHLLEELAVGVIVVPEHFILWRPDVLASLVQHIEFPCPLSLWFISVPFVHNRRRVKLTSEITSGTGV